MPRSRLACFALLCILLAPAPSRAETIYVTTSGLSTGAGTQADPVDLTTGFSRLDPGDAMRIASGVYTWTTGPLPIPSDVTIEGSFAVAGGVWGKDLSVPTTIMINPPLATVLVGPTNVGYFAGINMVSRSNVTIADLKLNVKPSGASGTFSNRGITVYTARLEGCSNITFSRVNALRGSASDGPAGSAGSTGASGSNGFNGGVGSIDDQNACGLGGRGAAGGGSVTSTNPPSICATSASNGLGVNGSAGSSLRMGGAGGSGGSGGANSYYLGGLGGGGGAGGGGASGGPAGGRGAAPDCQGLSGGVGANGQPGATGFSGGSRPGLGPANRAAYFVPSGQSASGADGAGGAGAGGGGGGGGQQGFFCTDGAGSGGGGGGGGGQGGTGGTGGWGGGATYGFYLVSNGANVKLTCCVFGAGTAGVGGTAGNGGAGGSGGTNGLGGPGNNEIGAGGNAGSGGAGGAGGRGQDGANGESVDILVQSGTAPVIAGGGADVDGDGRFDVCDNCPGIANPNQEDDDINGVGNVCESVVAVGDVDAPPLAFALHDIHPNPTRAGATIRFDVPGAGGSVALRVYDAQGRCVRVLAEGRAEPGRRTVTWDARDARGTPVSAGLYFVRLSVADFTATRKLLVLRQ